MTYPIKDRVTAFFALMSLAATFLGGSAALASDETECEGTIGVVKTSSVIVPDGEICTLDGTQVQGDVTVKSGATLVTTGASIEGSIQGESAKSVTLNPGTRVQGNVQLQKGNSITIDQAEIRGELQLQDNDGPVDVANSQIGGSFQAKNNDGGTQISSNAIANNLQCQDNDPAPTGSGNTAAQKQGQCEEL